MHRVGGLEKEDGSGNISYDPENHDKMTRSACREDRRHRDRHPARRGRRPDGADFIVVSLGRYVGRVDRGGASSARTRQEIAHVHLRHTATRSRGTSVRCCARYRTVFVPELNMGHLARLLRAEYLVDADSYTRVAGVPFKAAELENEILELMARE